MHATCVEIDIRDYTAEQHQRELGQRFPSIGWQHKRVDQIFPFQGSADIIEISISNIVESCIQSLWIDGQRTLSKEEPLSIEILVFI